MQEMLAGHARQSSLLSDRSAHARQSSLLSDRSGHSYSDLSFGWTGSSQMSDISKHSRQRSNISDRSSDWPPQTYDNGGFETSPRCRRLPHRFYHSRQSSAEMSSLDQPPPQLAVQMPPHYLKFSPLSHDQGYHTMVGPHSSPDISPGASMDLSSLSLSCPRVTRPRPPAVPDTVHLDHRNMRVGFSSSARLGQFQALTEELILRVLSYLDTVSLVRVGQVCRQFYQLAWHPTLWSSLSLAGDRLDADAAVSSVLSLLSSRHCEVTRLELAGCTRLSDAGLAVISRTCPTLNRLNIRACSVTNTGLAQLVARCSRLQHLDISGCGLVSGLEPNSASSRGPLRERLQGLALTHLDLTDCTRLDDQSLRSILQASSNMEFLYVRRCNNLTDLGIKMISAYCFVLRELSISDCDQISDVSLLELARLGPKLRYLSAAKCYRITDRGVTAIARHCYKLRYLNVRGCEAVSDLSLQALAMNCNKLRSLDIGKCDVTDAGLQVISEKIPSLRKLSVRGCEMISDVGVEAVAQQCHNLHLLNIQECQVGLNTYRMVKKFCKKCIIEHTNPGFH